MYLLLSVEYSLCGTGNPGDPEDSAGDYDLARRIRRFLFDGRERLESCSCLTGIMCGEGEETFLELMDYYHGQTEPGATLEQIRGIVYRDESGNIHINPPRPVMDLSRVPFVYSHIEDFRNRIIYYESSRGCPFSCSYCLSSIDKCLRFRDIGLVKKELQFFIDHEVPQVKFVGRRLTADMTMPWQCGVILKNMTEELQIFILRWRRIS